MMKKHKWKLFVIAIGCMALFQGQEGRTTVVKLPFTPGEEAFIKNHPVITVGANPYFMPFEGFDEKGQYQGVASDYLKAIERQTGLRFEIQKEFAWYDSYNKALDGKVDLLPAMENGHDSEMFFLLSKPYFNFRRGIIVRESDTAIRNLDDLRGKNIAVQFESVEHDYLNTLSLIELHLYASIEEALIAVSTGNEVAAMGNLSTAGYYISQNGITNLKFILLEDNSRGSLHFAARREYRELMSIIDKVLGNIPLEEKRAINNAWIQVSESVDYTLMLEIISIVAFIIILIFTISIYWILRMRQEIEIRASTQKRMELAKHDAEAANRIKSNFLARMSHEIRTPMNAVIGMTYLLTKTDITATQSMYLRNIDQAASTILGIINDILDFSKIEAGKVELERTSFNLDEVLQNAVNIVSYRAREKRVGFKLIRDVTLPFFFHGDPKRIEQVLLNILNNAVKFTKEGEVAFYVRMNSLAAGQCHLSFIIHDTGVGMSEHQLEHLFEPFSQEDASINRQFGGTGLGLSIVKNLVELMNGSIRVQSVKGKGSRFNIDILLDQHIEQEEWMRQEIAEVAAKNVKILVWEKAFGDEPVVSENCTVWGVKNERISSETEAFAALEEASNKGTPFEIFILDYDAPPNKGFDFIDDIRKNERIVMPLIIMLLPMAGEEARLHEYERIIGISKPVIFSILFKELYAALQDGARKQPAVAPADETAPAAAPQTASRILVVDDNEINRTIAESLLEAEGFVVFQAENGNEGVRMFEEHQDEICAVLMDLHMPGGINGTEAAERIRRLSKTIPIAAMTADVLEGVQETCESHGMHYFISKPFDPKHFTDQVRAMIESGETT
ncbi:MAG: transporter substrate-binding domain-containing protein [Treponema sp.]|jgi:signal transduction histidine kinase/CheY-like chemotaxis protein|nr:transporter substrate-binding domain-containing protein [Treponema sp.]